MVLNARRPVQSKQDGSQCDCYGLSKLHFVVCFDVSTLVALNVSDLLHLVQDNRFPDASQPNRDKTFRRPAILDPG